MSYLNIGVIMNISIELFDIFVISETVEQIIVVGFPHVNNINRPCHSINYIWKWHMCVCVCQCAKFDQFLPWRSHFDSKRPEIFVRIAIFPSATFGPLFSFHCPLFVTKNNNFEWKSSRFAAVDRRSVADKQLHLNGVIHSASVAQCQELSPKT